MFLADCPPELAAKRDRIACRQLVTRTLTHRNPAADTFALLANHLTDATTVTQLDEHTVRIDDTIVFWTIGDVFDGEDDDPVPDELPWSAATAHAVDVFGTSVPVWTIGSKIHIERTVTPGFVTV